MIYILVPAYCVTLEHIVLLNTYFQLLSLMALSCAVLGMLGACVVISVYS